MKVRICNLIFYKERERNKREDILGSVIKLNGNRLRSEYAFKYGMVGIDLELNKIEEYSNYKKIDELIKIEFENWKTYESGNLRNLDINNHINYLKESLIALEEIIWDLNLALKNEDYYMRESLLRFTKEVGIKKGFQTIKERNEEIENILEKTNIKKQIIERRILWVKKLKLEKIEWFLELYLDYPEFVELFNKEYKIKDIDSLKSELGILYPKKSEQIKSESILLIGFSGITNNKNKNEHKNKLNRIKKMEGNELENYKLSIFNNPFTLNFKASLLTNKEFDVLFKILNTDYTDWNKNEELTKILNQLNKSGVYKRFVIVSRFHNLPNRQYILDLNNIQNKIDYSKVKYGENILSISFTSLDDLVSETRYNLYAENLGESSFQDIFNELNKMNIIGSRIPNEIKDLCKNLNNKGIDSSLKRYHVNSFYKNSLFLFKDMSIDIINRIFKQNNIYISSGMNNLKAFLNPMDLKLNLFLYNYFGEGAYDIVKDSFNILSSKEGVYFKSQLDTNEKIELVKFKKSRKKENIIINKINSIYNFVASSIDNILIQHYLTEIESKEKTVIENQLDDKNNKEVLDIKESNKKILIIANNLKANKSYLNLKKNGKREYHSFSKWNLYKKKKINQNTLSTISILKNENVTKIKKGDSYNKNLSNIEEKKEKNENSLNNVLNIMEIINMDLINNKEFIIENKKPSISSIQNSLLNHIFKLINEDSLSSFDKQMSIETFWLELSNEVTSTLDYKFKKIKYGIPSFLIESIKSLEIVEKKYTARIGHKKKFFSYYSKLLQIKNIILMITYSTAMSCITKNFKWVYTCSIIGERILTFLYYENLFKKIKSNTNLKNLSLNQIFSDIKKQKELVDYLLKNKIEYSYENFLSELNIVEVNKEYVKLGDHFLELLTLKPFNIFDRIVGEKDENYAYKLAISEEGTNEIFKNFVLDLPSIPMLCKPKKWSENKKGGLLLTATNESIILNDGKHGHEINNKKIIYDTVNYLNSIKFSINNDFLNFLETELGKKFILEEVAKMDKSEYFLFQHTYLLAKLYSKVTFFLPVKVDFRGRIYVNSYYLNYQGNDFSKVFINYSEGKALDSKGLINLKIYGASLYNENNMSKESTKEKLKWIEEHTEEILNMNKEFIYKSENKWLFINFCLIMINIKQDKNFKVNLPIYIDASCSGMQHLAAMLNDFEVGFQTNLVPQTIWDKPNDIYSYMVPYINELINFEGEKENSSYPKFKYLKLSRKHLKLLIMTTTYNVSIMGMRDQLLNNATKVEIINKNNLKNKANSNKAIKKKYKYLLPTHQGEDIEIEFKEFYALAIIINKCLFDKFPYLKIIYDYFKNIAIILSNLGLPVVWITPAGLELKQLYWKDKITRLTLSDWGNSKTLILKEWTKILDKRSQVNAIIPNIIHSLDAAHLMKIINIILLNYNILYFPVLPIHDCFGIHPNDMENIFTIIKIEFIMLYSNKKFLNKFHSNIIHFLKKNNITVRKKNSLDIIIFNEKEILLPNIPELGTLNIEDIIHSKYMFN